VLIVDDEEDLRDLLEHILQSFGFEVKTANHGKMALDFFQEFQFDLVVSDVVQLKSGIANFSKNDPKEFKKRSKNFGVFKRWCKLHRYRSKFTII
jgi:DNA-binding NtrC family response regulator